MDRQPTSECGRALLLWKFEGLLLSVRLPLVDHISDDQVPILWVKGSDIDKEEWYSECEKDTVRKLVTDYVVEGWPSLSNYLESAKAFWNVKDELSIVEGNLYRLPLVDHISDDQVPTLWVKGSAIDKEEWYSECEKDTVRKLVTDYVVEGWPSLSNYLESAKAFWNIKDKLSIVEGLH
ncbi:hypothetical protein NDU88_003897 [Pleurodeles waltl]|uniref:Uncharacterized protein n=1 Tax=Pleurodeles waltl TaxID=8319 RepID=A0AAV7VHA2_PLEWA|nr:hypothetical protein NDU88_003897 [Pleurodeles waltl]